MSTVCRQPGRGVPDSAYLTKVDEDGVPRLVQRFDFILPTMRFEATLFTGHTVRFTAESICPSLAMLHYPSAEQWAEAYESATAILVNIVHYRACHRAPIRDIFPQLT